MRQIRLRPVAARALMAAAASLWIAGVACAGEADGVSDEALRGRCKAIGASRYGVDPGRVAPGQVQRSGSGYAVDGIVEKGANGMTKLRCLFKPDRSFQTLLVMTPDD